MDYKIYDLTKELLTSSTNKDQSSHVVIVDIDDASLNTFGQWPWPRILLAQLVSDINTYKPTTIALDIIFPEKDRTSPNNFNSFYHKYLNISNAIVNIPEHLHDNDTIFSRALQKTQSTLSVYVSKNYIMQNNCDYEDKLKLPLDLFDLHTYPYVLCNTEKISANFANIGFINTKVDEDGLLRRYQLIRRYQDTLLPSLGLATLLKIDPDFISINQRTFEIMGHQFNTDKSSNVLLSYYPETWYKKISAQDILQKRIKKEDIYSTPISQDNFFYLFCFCCI